jgi:uncharacterized protein (DUF2267 family)
VQAFERFITAVRLGAGLDRPAAERAAQAVLTTLCERISGGQADDVAQRLKLPEGFIPSTLTLPSRPADRFGLDEFLRRAAEREQADGDVARAHASTVLNALRLVLPPKEFADIVDQLPGEIEQLVSAPWRPHRPLRTVQELLQLVADRSGLSADEARRATEAVLEGLAERLPDKEVAALLDRLPGDLRAALERGRAGRTAQRRLDLDDFLELLGERTGTDPQRAREHARAVVQVLTEALDDQMLADLLVELPDDYADLLGARLSPAGAG